MWTCILYPCQRHSWSPQCVLDTTLNIVHNCKLSHRNPHTFDNSCLATSSVILQQKEKNTCNLLFFFQLRHLIECLVDSGKTAEAAIYAKVAEEFIKLHVPQLYRKLFLKQVRVRLYFRLIHKVQTFCRIFIF